MNPLLLGPLFEMGKALIDRVLPDPAAQQAAQTELVKMTLDGEMKNVVSQLQINLADAQSPRFWQSGWRPYFGWVGGTGFLYAVLLKPALTWVAAIKGWPAPPDLDTELLWIVVSGLLGIGGLRTLEKKQGTAK